MPIDSVILSCSDFFSYLNVRRVVEKVQHADSESADSALAVTAPARSLLADSPTMPAVRLRPTARQTHGAMTTTIAVAAIIISLATAAIALWLWDRHRKRGAKIGQVIGTRPCDQSATHGLHPSEDPNGLETGIIRHIRIQSEDPPRYRESL